jgi:hypothetical protein
MLLRQELAARKIARGGCAVPGDRSEVSPPSASIRRRSRVHQDCVVNSPEPVGETGAGAGLSVYFADAFKRLT